MVLLMTMIINNKVASIIILEKHLCFFKELLIDYFIKRQSCHHIETSGFYMMATLASNELMNFIYNIFFLSKSNRLLK